jgi:DNA-directed RNA polymerase specialized sigma24 family protein
MNQALKDEELVLRILNGETHLYEMLMRKFNQQLYRIGMSIVNDDQEVEDIMQITYLNAYRQALSIIQVLTPG